MGLEDRVRELRQQRVTESGRALPEQFQGVSKVKIREVLSKIDRDTPDIVDVVFSLLDNDTMSWFAKTPKEVNFANGASTAHIGCHVGILQRGGNKLDREGRDYWIKPLSEIGAIEQIYYTSGRFVYGHPVPKSPNSAYRLADDFKKILCANRPTWKDMLTEWIAEDNMRIRLEYQAKMAAFSKRAVDTKHADLIEACREIYVTKFLKGYEVIYIDEADGERVTDKDRASLKRAGLGISLADAMPDILLWHPHRDRLWIIEAVTSDGEVDRQKVEQTKRLAKQYGKEEVGFTTAYLSWKDMAARQGVHKNIAPNTYIWIMQEPLKQFMVLDVSDSISPD